MYAPQNLLEEGVLSTDQRYLYFRERGSGTSYVFDVQDVDQPFYVGPVDISEAGRLLDFFILDDLLYCANGIGGLRVLDLKDALAPAEVAWFDTNFTSTSALLDGLSTCCRLPGSGVVLGGDSLGRFFVWDVSDQWLQIELPGGAPELLNPGGETLAVTIEQRTVGDLLMGTERLHFDDGSGRVDLPLTDLGAGAYLANLPAARCGSVAAWSIEATTTDGWTYSSGGLQEDGPHRSLVVDSQAVAFEDTMETDTGWTAGLPSDTAITGIWERDDPIGTLYQPEFDHSPDPGSQCWFTGQGTPMGAAGENDVDGGVTTLLSPFLDVTGTIEPHVSYWLWYTNAAGNNPGADVFEVSGSPDGVQWTSIEVIGPDGDGTNGGWRLHSFRLTDFPLLAGASQVQLRFVASDLGEPSLVEAAVDDLRVYDPVCGLGSAYCLANPNSRGLVGWLSATGSAVVTDNDVTLTASGLPFQASGYFLASRARGFVPNPAGSAGNFCLSGSVARFVALAGNSGATGSIRATPNLSAIPTTPFSSVMSGETWYFQLWHRDFVTAPTSNFTDAIAILFL